MNQNYKKFKIIKYTLEIQKYFQIKGSLIKTMVVWEELTGLLFYVKKIKSFFFDSFCSLPDKFLLNQLTEPITYHVYKIQDKNSIIRGSYCF